MTMSFSRVAAAAVVVCGLTAAKAEAAAINLAPIYGTAIGSSEVYGAAALAIDNNLATTYPNTFQTGMELNPYLVVDLGANFSLTSLNIYQRTDEAPRLLNDFSITVFDMLGNVTYNSTFAVNPGDTVGTPFTVNFGSVIQGKAVQIVLDNTSPDSLAIAELQIISDVPEPASLALLGAGVLALAGVGRRFRGGQTA